MKEENQEQAAPKQIRKAAKEAPPLHLIYLGPNLPGGRLSTATVFRGSIPGHLADLRDKHPQIDDLIVPLSEIARTHDRIAAAGSPQYEAYQSLKVLSGKGV